MSERLYSIRDYSTYTPLTQTQFDGLHLILDSELTDITATTEPTLADGAYGWKLRLNLGSGEKVVTSARTLNNVVYFTSYTPSTTVTSSSDPCGSTAQGSGTNRVYAVNVFTGAPIKDRNDDGSISVDDRSTELKQGGIAPGISLLFPEKRRTRTTCWSCLGRKRWILAPTADRCARPIGMMAACSSRRGSSSMIRAMERLARRHSGVTLIELMIVIVVLAILGGISVSTYRRYTLRANRTDATTMLLRTQVAQEKFFLQQNRYATSDELTTAPPAGLGLGLGSAGETPNGYYVITLDGDDTHYTATATAQNGQTERAHSV